jgi:hypothetical protein
LSKTVVDAVRVATFSTDTPGTNPVIGADGEVMAPTVCAGAGVDGATGFG